MKNQAFPKTFKDVVAVFLKSTLRLAMTKRSFSAAGRIKKLTAALDADDVFLPLLAAEELAKTGRADSLPGLRRALGCLASDENGKSIFPAKLMRHPHHDSQQTQSFRHPQPAHLHT